MTDERRRMGMRRMWSPFIERDSFSFASFDVHMILFCTTHKV